MILWILLELVELVNQTGNLNLEFESKIFNWPASNGQFSVLLHHVTTSVVLGSG